MDSMQSTFSLPRLKSIHVKKKMLHSVTDFHYVEGHFFLFARGSHSTTTVHDAEAEGVIVDNPCTFPTIRT